MKQFLYALLAFCAFGLVSCRKSSDNFTIKQFDANQIQTYIQQNGIVGMKQDTSAGDTSGIYYQVINQGTGKLIGPADKIHYTFSLKSFDGKYTSADTIFNHVSTYAAYVAPLGVQLAILNIMKHKGAKMRVLIPSRLAYGTNGTAVSAATSTTTTSSGTIEGNQCLDVTITLVNDDVTTVGGITTDGQAVYDELSIQNYLRANNLTSLYTKIATGVYYRITQPGTGTDIIGFNSSLGVSFTGLLFDGAIAEDINADPTVAATSLSLYDALPAWQQALPKTTAGSKISIISSSGLTYGPETATPTSGTFTIPAFSCMRYEFNVVTVAN